MSRLTKFWRKNAGRWRRQLGLVGPEVSGSVLSIEPAIIYTTIDHPDLTNFVRAFGSRVGERRATILIYMSWFFGGSTAGRLIEALRNYRRTHSTHEVLLLCNEQDEVENAARLGERALLLNHNLTVSDSVFRPLDGIQVEFDAVYNARLAKFKRIDLAAAIDRVEYIYESDRTG